MFDNQKNQIYLQDKKFPIKYLILIIAVITVLVATYVLIEKEPQSSDVPLTTVKSEGEGVVAKPNYDILAVDYFEGEVERINRDHLIVQVSDQELNPFLQGKTFEVFIDEASKIFLLNGPFYIVQDREKTELTPLLSEGGLKSQPSGINIFVAGDMVLVLSRQDIRDEISFVAREIYKKEL